MELDHKVFPKIAKTQVKNISLKMLWKCLDCRSLKTAFMKFYGFIMKESFGYLNTVTLFPYYKLKKFVGLKEIVLTNSRLIVVIHMANNDILGMEKIPSL